MKKICKLTDSSCTDISFLGRPVCPSSICLKWLRKGMSITLGAFFFNTSAKLFFIWLHYKYQSQISYTWRSYCRLHVFSMLIVLFIAFVEVGPNVLLTCPRSIPAYLKWLWTSVSWHQWVLCVVHSFVITMLQFSSAILSVFHKSTRIENHV